MRGDKDSIGDPEQAENIRKLERNIVRIKEKYEKLIQELGEDLTAAIGTPDEGPLKKVVDEFDDATQVMSQALASLSIEIDNADDMLPSEEGSQSDEDEEQDSDSDSGSGEDSEEGEQELVDVPNLDPAPEVDPNDPVLIADVDGAWGEYKTKEGEIFYWNKDTGESSWDHPDDVEPAGEPMLAIAENAKTILNKWQKIIS
tara:strand:- start:428 stop:1030 length:603 start_codon:yes stop_codon:yes gene_type:complete